MNNMNYYNHKEILQLESWQTNNYISQDMKNFYLDVLQALDDLENTKFRINNLEQDLSNIKFYLDAKGMKNEYTKFELFMQSNPQVDLNAVRAYFRKQKIAKILNEEF